MIKLDTAFVDRGVTYDDVSGNNVWGHYRCNSRMGDNDDAFKPGFPFEDTASVIITSYQSMNPDMMRYLRTVISR